MNIEQKFIDVMRGFAATVNVVSSRKLDERQAMTASAVTSLSLSPPTILVCINKKAAIHEILELDNNFCINILNSEQQEIAEICSGKQEGEVRFEAGTWLDDLGSPFLYEAQSNIFCKCIETIDQLSHTIFLGEVLNIKNNKKRSPLIYLDGEFTKI